MKKAKRRGRRDPLHTLVTEAQAAGCSAETLVQAIQEVMTWHQLAKEQRKEMKKQREEIKRLLGDVETARDAARKLRLVAEGLTLDTQEQILKCARFVISHLRDKQRWADNERSAMSAATSLIQSDGPVVTFVVDPGG